VWHPRWALTLLSTTALLLFLPKLLSILLAMVKGGGARRFGGFFRILASMGVEVLFSMLFAPIRMLFHSKFVFVTLLGRQVGWGAQQRSDEGTGWLEAFRFHGPGTLLAILWGAALFLFNRSFFWWNTPIIIPLILSAPLSVWSSRASMGRVLRKLGLFLIPEEVMQPPELKELQKGLRESETRRDTHPLGRTRGFVRVVVDPAANALHRALLRGERKLSPVVDRRRQGILQKALEEGPSALSGKEKRELLHDPDRLEQMHAMVWEIPDPGLVRMWGFPP
jgi:membrane glycosyltransferase